MASSRRGTKLGSLMEAIELGLAAVGTLRCASCGGVIGVYEPLVQVVDGIARKTSRAADPHLARAQADACYHLACREKDTAQAVSAA